MQRQIFNIDSTEMKGAHPDFYRKTPKKYYSYIIHTDDPQYAPLSRKDVNEIFSQYNTDAYPKAVSQGDLYVVDKQDVIMTGDIITLVASSVIGSCLLLMGFIAPFINVLPPSTFWWTMAFPALGTSFAVSLIVRKKMIGDLYEL